MNEQKITAPNSSVGADAGQSNKYDYKYESSGISRLQGNNKNIITVFIFCNWKPCYCS